MLYLEVPLAEVPEPEDSSVCCCCFKLPSARTRRESQMQSMRPTQPGLLHEPIT